MKKPEVKVEMEEIDSETVEEFASQDDIHESQKIEEESSDQG